MELKRPQMFQALNYVSLERCLFFNYLFDYRGLHLVHDGVDFSESWSVFPRQQVSIDSKHVS